MSKAKLGNELSSGGLSELKKRLLFVLIGIIVFRLGAYIPIPGISPDKMMQFFHQDTNNSGKSFLGMFDLFSGGSFSRMTIFALSIMPYISASIIVQMYGAISPKLIQLKKEGEAGRRKINKYTRLGTLVLATLQAFFIAMWLANSHIVSPSLANSLPYFYILAMSSLVTGTMFLLWLGEQMTERGIGNGISLIIFSGIVARFPSAISSLLAQKKGDFITILVISLIILAVTLIVVFVERAQRRIQVKYAKRQQGRKMYAAQTSHLPLKINMAGVIPPIFAQSILMFIGSIPRFLNMYGKDSHYPMWLQHLFSYLTLGSPAYMVIFAILIIFFGFFYTALVFNPKETSDNLRSQGGYINGIRPGDKTADYIDSVMTRLTCIGVIYLALVSLLPMFLRLGFNVPFWFGGTSLLIVVVVLMDFIAQVQSHLLSSHYHSLMKKTKTKGSRGGLLRS
jgi:preprotein translocase subunit SecY